MSTCRACGAPIRWERTEARGKAIPLDRDPVDAGNAILIRHGARDVVRVLGPLELELLEADVVRYMPHHATCPDVDEFR
jgi:hypothetical protein